MKRITKQLLPMLMGILVISGQMVGAEQESNEGTNIKINNMTDYRVWFKDINQKNVGFGPRQWGTKEIQPKSGDIIELKRWVSDEQISRAQGKGPAPVTAELLFGLDKPEENQSINLELSPNSPKQISKERRIGGKSIVIAISIKTESKVSNPGANQETFYDYTITIKANPYWDE